MEKNKIVNYYNECHIDYKILWRLDKGMGLHYGFYDGLHTKHDEAVINMNRILAGMVKITPQDKVLDAGCGIGGSSIWIAKNLGANVVGINITDGQLKIAESLAIKNNVASLVKFFKRDFSNTGFPDDSFSVVWGLESICHAQSKKDFIKEAKRILKNSGRIIIADLFIQKENLEANEKNEMKKWLDGWAVPNLASVNEFGKYLEEAGFKNIKFRDVKENIMPSSARMYKASIPGLPIGKLLEFLKIRTKAQTGNIVSAFYQHKTLKNGLWAYGIFSAEK